MTYCDLMNEMANQFSSNVSIGWSTAFFKLVLKSCKISMENDTVPAYNR